MRLKILPYKITSKSAKSLGKALGCMRIRTNKLTYRYLPNTTIINWGYGGSLANQRIPETAHIINKPKGIRTASSKLYTLDCLTQYNVPTLKYTTDRDTAQDWLDSVEVYNIYCRHLLSSNSGQGIQVVSFGEQVPESPLYTAGLYKWTEWRFHVGVLNDNNVHKIAIQQKIKRDTGGSSGIDDIRNHGNDYIFKRNNLKVPKEAEGLEVAGKAIKAIGLEFAGIDMAFTQEGWKVIEVNTAPGLTGSTITDYANYFKRRIL